jgi:sterol desaturase/sphingolipid hydroxylase (fatty acid hydroxylase superfamily)
MLVGWLEILLITAWIGPFVFTGLFTIAERRWASGSYPEETHLKANLFFGGISSLIAFLFLQNTQDLVADSLGIYDFVDFSAPALPSFLQYALCFLFIDFVYYAQHRLSHLIPVLWRIHKVHHSDDRVTASTSLVHHPLEALFIGVTAFAIYVIVNMPVGVILAYGAINSIHVVFVHSNIMLPSWLDRGLSRIIYTPSLHKIHHSIRAEEGNSNFGMIFVFWDQFLSSWRAHASLNSSAIEMGLDETKSMKWSFKELLFLPFRQKNGTL